MAGPGRGPWIGGFALALLAVTPAWGAPCAAVPATASVAFQALLDDEGCRPDLKPFAHLAWQTFKLLVWPASKHTRGQADEARSLSEMNGPRVFETLKSDWETFPPNAVAPLPWNQYPATAAMCQNASPIAYPASRLVLGSLHKFGNIRMPDLGFAAVLMAQNGKPVRYLAAFDRNAFTMIETNKLYDPANVPPPSGEAPAATVTAVEGTIVVKSAWVEMDGIAADTFHTRTAVVQDLDGTCREATIGLVGLHIMHKTRFSPQWIWASFEHVRNVPSPAAATTPGFTFNDASGTPMDPSPPLAARNPGRPGWSFPPPYNVERHFPIEDDIKSVNADWHAVLQGSVWANYELVLVQWPGVAGDASRSGLGEQFQGRNGVIVGANPTPPCILNSPADPRNLANSVLEPFGQRDIGCGTNSQRTCMGCHNGVRSNDFIFALPNNAPFAGAGAVPQNRRSTIEYLRSITGWDPPPAKPR